MPLIGGSQTWGPGGEPLVSLTGVSTGCVCVTLRVHKWNQMHRSFGSICALSDLWGSLKLKCLWTTALKFHPKTEMCEPHGSISRGVFVAASCKCRGQRCPSFSQGPPRAGGQRPFVSLFIHFFNCWGIFLSHSCRLIVINNKNPPSIIINK